MPISPSCKRILIVLLLLALCVPARAAGSDGLTGHWAQSALRWAATEQLLSGSTLETLDPEGPLTGAQAVVVLCRLLNAQDPAAAYPGTQPSDWYYSAACCAAAGGILPRDGSLDLTAALTRAQAWTLLCRAFGLIRAQPDEAVLADCTDLAGITPAQRRAAAVLAQQGVLQTASGALEPGQTLTRAQFVTMLYRLVMTGSLEVFTGSSVTLANAQLRDLFLDCAVRSVSLTGVSAQSIAIRSGTLDSLTLQDVTARTLTLGQAAGLPTLTAAGFERIYVTGAGCTLQSGSLDALELSAQDAVVELQGVNVERLTLSGSGCTLHLDADSTVGELVFTADSGKNRVELAGRARTIVLAGLDNDVTGGGSADTLRRQSASGSVSVSCAALVDEQPSDTGLTGLTLDLQAPALTPGDPLTANVYLTGVTGQRTVYLAWYLDGALIREYPDFALYDGARCGLWEAVGYGWADHSLGVYVRYDNPVTGQRETAWQTADALMDRDAWQTYQSSLAQLAATVSGDYAGNYTESYNVDYSDAVKEAFINTGGYTSQTDYLVWVSRAAQKVNIFQKSANGAWSLLHTFRCGTGASGTPAGVTYIFGKQTDWTTSTYSVYNVVNFYPGTGFAFHSRLYAPGTLTLTDAGIGYPISHGCVRMYLEDVQWMWDTLPIHTTVVIY